MKITTMIAKQSLRALRRPSWLENITVSAPGFSQLAGPKDGHDQPDAEDRGNDVARQAEEGGEEIFAIPRNGAERSITFSDEFNTSAAATMEAAMMTPMVSRFTPFQGVR